MQRPEVSLAARLAPAFEAIAGEPADPGIRRSDHADFQADGALRLAKQLGRPSRDVAHDVIDRANLGDLCSNVEVSGPGFINLTVTDDVLSRALVEAASDARLGVGRAERLDRVVIDYSAPNAAKEMHVGHLRSTIIGDAIARLLAWRGHEVLRENHIGDWGTPFGMLIEHLLDIGEQEAARELAVGDLNAFYQAAREKFDLSEEFKARARRRVVEFQQGDAETLRLWRALVDSSDEYFLAVYNRLGVLLTDADLRGESTYNDRLPSVVDELEELGLLTASDGALCVFPDGFMSRDNQPLPIIVKKADGGFGYGATDLATIRERLRDIKATRILYVVGLPQRQHLEMVFETAREAGWLRAGATATHVGHGSILGDDGKILRTRRGASVKLSELLDEAVERAREQVDAKSPEVNPEVRAELARQIGIGAVKYADLSTDRMQDYQFTYERMLAFEGNTAPYLQYAHARIRSIFRRGKVTTEVRDRILLSEPIERALAVDLLGFAGVIEEVEATLQPHRLANYLYGVAVRFTKFYEHCPVLKAEPEVRASRLVLCDITASTLAVGLSLLGIAAPDRM